MTITLGHTSTGALVEIDTSYLNHHTFVCGSTGSGKTGQVIGIVEQAMYQKVPVILVDVKGDMLNAIQQQEAILEELNVQILTPGATHGTPVNLFLGLNDKDTAYATLEQLCELIGVSRNPTRSKAFAFLSAVVEWLHKKGKPCNIEALMANCQTPQIKKVGMLDVSFAVSSKMRHDLLLRLNGLFCDPKMEDWMQGIDLDIAKLLERKDDKTPVVIYSVKHLTDDNQKMFALTLFFERMVAWMREEGGKGQLRGLLVVDECYGMMPPHPQVPATKPLLTTMFKQGRDCGLGLICATQNAKDVDYKILSNCHTWIIGRLQTENDRKRVLEAVEGDKKIIGKQMNALGRREFLHIHEGKVDPYTSRDVNARLTGPASMKEVSAIHDWFHPKRKLKGLLRKAIDAFNGNKNDRQTLLALVQAQNAYMKAGGKL